MLRSFVHLVTVENLIRNSGPGNPARAIRANLLRLKGKNFAWRMELPSPFRLEITEFFS